VLTLTYAVILGLVFKTSFAQTLPNVASNALPTGASVVSGSATVSQSGNAMVINQTSNTMVANWNSFNIGRDASVTFQQPSRSSVAINRIQSAEPTQVQGQLNANGQVVLVNPNGVIFANGSRVDVGSLIASTRDVTTTETASGTTYQFSGTSSGQIDQAGQVRTADGGYVVMVAPQITNSGSIQVAGRGSVAMLAGNQVRVQVAGNSLVGYRIEQGALNAAVTNTGEVTSQGGTITLSARSLDALTSSVVNQRGIVRASSFNGAGGKVILDADRVELAAGSETSATGTTDGGRVEILAKTATIQGSIDVSGASRGGQVYAYAKNSVSVKSASIKSNASVAEAGEIKVISQESVEVQSSFIQAIGETLGGLIRIAAEPTVPVASGTAAAEVGLMDPAHPLNNPTAPPSTPSRVAILGSSSISAAGRRARGGSIGITGDEITILDVSVLDATGDTGGGRIRIGGDWLGGTDPSLRLETDPLYEATYVRADSQTRIDASAVSAGDGGSVVLWSNPLDQMSLTFAEGWIYARGSPTSGAPGSVIITDGRGTTTSGAKIDTYAIPAWSNLASVGVNDTPIGGSVQSGSAIITATGSSLVIDQASDTVSLSWTSFNIGSSASVTFNQPDRNSVAINRIGSASPSQILGRLSSNGQIVLVNPNGIIFDNGSQVDVGSIMASTWEVVREPNASGASYEFSGAGPGVVGRIDQAGQLTTAADGYVLFVAPQIYNFGQTQTLGAGHIAMLSAREVDTQVSAAGQLVSYQVTSGVNDSRVVNTATGSMVTQGGTIALSGRSVDNLLSASKIDQYGLLDASNFNGAGGRVILDADAVALAANSDILATGTTTGGTVEILARSVLAKGDVNASGAQSGASLYIYSEKSFVAQNATLAANASLSQGGQIKVVSQGTIDIDDSVLGKRRHRRRAHSAHGRAHRIYPEWSGLADSWVGERHPPL